MVYCHIVLLVLFSSFESWIGAMQRINGEKGPPLKMPRLTLHFLILAHPITML